MKVRILVAATVFSGYLSLFPFDVFAHDVRLTPMGDGYVVFFGHKNLWSPYKPDKVGQVTGYDAGGKAFEIVPEPREIMLTDLPGITIEEKGAFVRIGGAGMMTLLLKEGYWTETSDGWATLPKNHFKEYKESSYYDMYNKTLFRWAGAYAKPVGLSYEVVPLADPWSAIEHLPVQVFYRGQPLAGATVEIDGDANEYTTDAQGKAVLPLKARGVHYIFSLHGEELDDDPRTDINYISSNLIFTR